jgi:GT2 family glycosyltransferase
VLDEVRFDEAYRGNAYREETDFFLRATYRGFRCLLTPNTYFWEPRRYPGGQPRTLGAELWTLRNNWRFLRRHGDWLAAAGHISSPGREQLVFMLRRLAATLW